MLKVEVFPYNLLLLRISLLAFLPILCKKKDFIFKEKTHALMTFNCIDTFILVKNLLDKIFPIILPLRLRIFFFFIYLFLYPFFLFPLNYCQFTFYFPIYLLFFHLNSHLSLLFSFNFSLFCFLSLFYTLSPYLFAQ